MTGIIDRFEGGFAVVETDSGFVNIPTDSLPAGAGEGSRASIRTGQPGAGNHPKTRNRIKPTETDRFSK